MTRPLRKLCHRCGAEKPLDDFPRDRHGHAGYGGWCKPCKSAQVRDWKRLHQTLPTRACAYCHQPFAPAPNGYQQDYCKRRGCQRRRAATRTYEGRNRESGSERRAPGSHPFVAAADAAMRRLGYEWRGAQWILAQPGATPPPLAAITALESELARTAGAQFAGIVAFALRERLGLAPVATRGRDAEPRRRTA